MEHILSELSTRTHPSWVALHGMAHRFIELHKAVIHFVADSPLPLDVGYLFLVGSNILLLMVVQQWVVVFSKEMNAHPSTLPSHIPFTPERMKRQHQSKNNTQLWM